MVVDWDRRGWLYGGAGELLVGGKLPIRAGYRRDQGRGEHQLSWGLGYVDRRMELDVSGRHILGNAGDLQLMAGLRFFIR